MITRRNLLKLTLASLVIPALRSNRASGAISPARAAVARAADARACPTLVLDGALVDVDHPWSREGLLAGVRAIHPPAVGYPGHHLADFWDWQTGWVDSPRLQNLVYSLPDSIRSLVGRSGCYDLDELKALCAATEAPVLYTANLLTRSGRLAGGGFDNPLKDAEAGKTHLLDGLRAYAARGISPRWLVLGDSLAGEQSWSWSPASAVFRGDPATGQTEYPQIALDWAAAARQLNPGLAAAAFAIGSQKTDESCAAQWNRRLVQAITGNASIRALAFSLTFPGGMGLSASTESGWNDSLQKAQYALLRQPDQLRALFRQPPAALQSWLDQPSGDGRTLRASGLRFWLNAFHLEDPIGALRYTWAHGLLLASALNAILREPLIDIVVLHNTAGAFHAAFFHPDNDQDVFSYLNLDAADGVDVPMLSSSVQPGGRTALGHVFALFLAAARGAAAAQPLVLDPIDDPLVWGWVFSHSSGQPQSVLLGNLSEAGATLNLSAVWAAAGGVIKGQVYRAAPNAFITRASSQPGVPFALQVSAAEHREDGLTLPPYSLALLSGLPLQNPVYLPWIQKYN